MITSLVLNEDFLHAHFNKANALANNNQFDDAIECYLEYLNLDQENDDAFCYLAECYLNTDKYSDALVYYQKAIRLKRFKLKRLVWFGSDYVVGRRIVRRIGFL